jgi:Holliday junction resolvase RusA-like endonuclease
MRSLWQGTIKGRVASKKNTRRNYGRVSLPSLAYERFNADAIAQILPTRPKNPISIPFQIHAWFYLKGKMRQDIDNSITGLLDTLMDAGVILDDNDCYAMHIYKRPGQPDFSTIIDIRELEA